MTWFPTVFSYVTRPHEPSASDSTSWGRWFCRPRSLPAACVIGLSSGPSPSPLLCRQDKAWKVCVRGSDGQEGWEHSRWQEQRVYLPLLRARGLLLPGGPAPRRPVPAAVPGVSASSAGCFLPNIAALRGPTAASAQHQPEARWTLQNPSAAHCAPTPSPDYAGGRHNSEGDRLAPALLVPSCAHWRLFLRRALYPPARGLSHQRPHCLLSDGEPSCRRPLLAGKGAGSGVQGRTDSQKLKSLCLDVAHFAPSGLAAWSLA